MTTLFFPRKYKLLLGAIMVLLLLQGSTIAALADGMILPFPADLGYVDVEYHRVTVEIHDGYAWTHGGLRPISGAALGRSAPVSAPCQTESA
jgi:hypothetical protein